MVLEIFDGLSTSIIKRPYVFIFLISFLVIAFRRWGWKVTLVWLVTCYLTAWASEYSSIHNGLPYGLYSYVYENLSGELLVFGVPFFDSLSYTFLIFSGYILFQSQFGERGIIAGAIGGGLFTMILDVIIDPVATMGSRWFLGEIHRYAYPGFYFGVPLTNFGGWFLTSAVAIAINIAIWKIFPKISPLKNPKQITAFEKHIPKLFYAGIALFTICIAIYLGEFLLSALSLIWLAFALRSNTFIPKNFKRE